MATAVRINVELDPSGAVTGAAETNAAVAQIGATATAAGKAGESAFNGIEAAETRAHISGKLLLNTVGIEMPRQFERVLASSSILGPAMAAAFNVAIFTTAASAIGEISTKINEAAQQLGGYTEEVKKAEQSTIDASRQAFVNPQTLDVARQHLDELNKERDAESKAYAAQLSRTQLAAAMPGIEGAIVGWLAAGNVNLELQNQARAKGLELDTKSQKLQEQIQALQKQYVHDALEAADNTTALAGLQGFAKIAEQEKQALAKINEDKAADAITKAKLVLDTEKQFSVERLALERQNAQQTMALRHQVADESLSAEQKIRADEGFSIQEQQRLLSQGLITRSDYEQRVVAYHQQANNKMLDLDRALAQEKQNTQNFILQKQEEGLSGAELTNAQETRELAALEAQRDALTAIAKTRALSRLEAQQLADIDQKEAAVTAAAKIKRQQQDQQDEQKRQQLVDQTAADVEEAQQAMALAGLPEWQKGTAQIQLELDKRLNAVNKAEEKELQQYEVGSQEYLLIEQDAQAKRIVIWDQANQKIQEEHKKQVEQLGSDLESVFDDIGSGNIGQRILNNMKKLFFQILAEWLLTSKQMGSGFASILGTLVFGPGSSSAGIFGGGSVGSGSSGGGLGGILGGVFGGSGSGATPPFVANSASATVAAGSSLAAGGQFSSLGSTASSATGSLLAASPYGALTTSALTQIGSGNASVGGLSIPQTGAAGATKTGLGSLLSPQGLMGIGGLAAVLAGSKLGAVGQAGTTLLGLGLSGHLSGLISLLYSSLGATGAAAVLGGGIGGSIGFGVGEQFGSGFGALSGAGTGAFTGFAIGGPLGAVIGGLIGLAGGVFGGIFGGNKRKKAAQGYFNDQVLPAIKTIESEYDSFQLDSNSAIQQLEQLKQQAQDQLKNLKSEGKDTFNKGVIPNIDNAEAHVRSTDVERQRRAALVFGPAQFHDGGLFSAPFTPIRTSPTEGLALLKHGEYVVNPTSTSRNLSALQAINAGAVMGGGNVHFHGDVNFNAQSIDEKWLRSGGVKQIVDAMKSYALEGH